jgi:hypothetical protein
MTETSKKRVTYIPTDAQLLFDCVKSQAFVLENKQTNKITPEMKRKVKKLIFYP